jgi:5-dehydro-2-deoxygluconokinase
MKNSTRFADGRRFDVIALGRLAVDFYAQQIGARLEDVRELRQVPGRSSANTAFGCARLGSRPRWRRASGDDAMGRFLVETLEREGCDVSHVSVDPRRLTAAVVLGIKDRDTFPLIFYRENCADMAVTEDDVAEDFLAQSRALLITGTHFSTPHVHRVSTTRSSGRAGTRCARCSTSTIARCCGAHRSAATARRASSRATPSRRISRASCRCSTS